jgi:hypothetical protein
MGRDEGLVFGQMLFGDDLGHFGFFLFAATRLPSNFRCPNDCHWYE